MSINDQILKDKLNNVDNLPCGDFLAFQDLLLRSRKIDDNITNLLNTSIPTDSFCDKTEPAKECKKIWEQLLKNYNSRDVAIKSCILKLSDNVVELRKQKDKDDNLINNRKYKSEQSKLRLLRNEISVEEILRNRSTKLYEERCRNFL